MAFGIPNSDGASGNGKFLGRLQVDARSGAWKFVLRKHDGQAYYDEETDPFFVSDRDPLTFLADFRSLEVGYIKFASPPDFRVVPFGDALPEQPIELTAPDANGKTRKAFQPGFRLQIYSPKRIGDEPVYFSNSGKGVLAAMDGLHQEYLAAPEALRGLVPAVSVLKMHKNETKTKFGTNTNYAPIFTVKSWHDRPEVFGDATVKMAGTPAASALQRPTASAQPVANHAPPPAARQTDAPKQLSTGMPDFAVVRGATSYDDEIPF